MIRGKQGHEVAGMLGANIANDRKLVKGEGRRNTARGCKVYASADRRYWSIIDMEKTMTSRVRRMWGIRWRQEKSCPEGVH